MKMAVATSERRNSLDRTHTTLRVRSVPQQMPTPTSNPAATKVSNSASIYTPGGTANSPWTMGATTSPPTKAIRYERSPFKGLSNSPNTSLTPAMRPLGSTSRPRPTHLQRRRPATFAVYKRSWHWSFDLFLRAIETLQDRHNFQHGSISNTALNVFAIVAGSDHALGSQHSQLL